MIDARRDLSEQAAARRATRRPVLIAIGATGGVEALRLGHTIATRYGSDVVVTSAVEPPPVYSFESNRAILLPWLLEQQVGERSESVYDRVQRGGGWPLGADAPRVEVRYGASADVIADVAREIDARLIVMGIGPHSLRHRLLSAGTTWATGRRAHCPLLAVADDARELPRVAVVATDFTPESIHAAKSALPLLADGAVMYLVHAWSRVEAAFPSVQLASFNETYVASLPERFTRMVEALGSLDGITVETLALEGEPTHAVLAVARAKHADLVVAGTRGRPALERWLLGSTSAAVLRGADCSVLLAPQPPVAERMALVRHMSGTSTVREPAEWAAELQAFVRRNRDRRTTLEVDDPSFGAQVQEFGLALVGATYDPHDHQVSLMFSDDARREVHLTRSLDHVRTVAVTSGPRDVDRALYIESERGGTLLTFLDEPVAAHPSANA
jgi:nucleotide-binding universal stress UspA family protein